MIFIALFKRNASFQACIDFFPEFSSSSETKQVVREVLFDLGQKFGAFFYIFGYRKREFDYPIGEQFANTPAIFLLVSTSSGEKVA